MVHPVEGARGRLRQREKAQCELRSEFQIREQALDDPHIRAARLLEEVTYPGLGETLPLAPTPIELSETPGTYRRPAPLPGEHTDGILRSLGYDAIEIATLRREQVV